MARRARSVSNKRNFLVPRRPKLKEQPLLERANNVPTAKAAVLKDFDKLAERRKRADIQLDKIQRSYDLEIKRVIENRNKKGLPAPANFFDKLKNRFEIKRRIVTNRITYLPESILRYTISALCPPDIDQISPFSISPGYSVALEGTCFGPPQGKVFLEIRQNAIVELEVSHWSETLIMAAPSNLLTGFGSHFGRIWIQTGAGITSNTWPIQFRPRLGIYLIQDTYSCTAYGTGKSCTHTAFEDGVLTDHDFSVEWTEIHHSGDGWSELRYPTANGFSLEQGYHIGVSWFGTGTAHILWRIIGPRDVPMSTNIPVPYGYLGDLP